LAGLGDKELKEKRFILIESDNVYYVKNIPSRLSKFLKNLERRKIVKRKNFKPHLAFTLIMYI